MNESSGLTKLIATVLSIPVIGAIITLSLLALTGSFG